MTTSDKEAGRLADFKALFEGSGLRSLEPRELLLQAARFERIEPKFKAKFANKLIEKRIAVLASNSTQHFLQVLKLFLYATGIAPNYYVGAYDGIVSEALDTESRLHAFKPETLMIFPSAEDIREFPALFADPRAIDEWIARQAGIYTGVWDAVTRKNPNCLVLHSLFVVPFVRQLGNLESNYSFSKSSCLRQLNAYFVANRPSNVILVDMDYFASFIGKDKWFDEVAFFVSKQPYSLHASKIVASYLSRALGATIGRIKKCLVLDLDNTLWGGVIGDDGLSGINIDPNNPVGEAYLALQRHLKALKERGVLLAVCSKNDERVARQPFTDHPDMILKLDDFAVFVANWDDKITNLRRISEQLNIGLDSLVLFDDNPAERALVTEFESRVEVIDVPEDPALFVRALDNSFCFEWLQLSSEDVSRVDSYVKDRKRQELQSQFDDYDAYLISLEMEAWVEFTDDNSLPRVAQLFNKTNQFNVRTQRYSEGALRNLQQQPHEYAVMQIRLKDKFTNYGIISSLVLRLADEAVFIDNWVMSCRVFKRGVENLAAEAIGKWAKSKRLQRVIGEYVPTQKNSYVAKLYEELGFSPLVRALPGDLLTAGGSAYEMPIETCARQRHHIRLHSAIVE